MFGRNRQTRRAFRPSPRQATMHEISDTQRSMGISPAARRVWSGLDAPGMSEATPHCMGISLVRSRLYPIAERGTCPFFEQRHLFELGHHIVIVLFEMTLRHYRRSPSGAPTGRYLQRVPSADSDPIVRSGKFGHCFVVGTLSPQVDDSLVLSILLYFDHSLPLCYSSWGLKNSISSY